MNVMNQKQFAARGIVTQQRNIPNQTLKIATSMSGKLENNFCTIDHLKYKVYILYFFKLKSIFRFNREEK